MLMAMAEYGIAIDYICILSSKVCCLLCRFELILNNLRFYISFVTTKKLQSSIWLCYNWSLYLPSYTIVPKYCHEISTICYCAFGTYFKDTVLRESSMNFNIISMYLYIVHLWFVFRVFFLENPSDLSNLWIMLRIYSIELI